MGRASARFFLLTVLFALLGSFQLSAQAQVASSPGIQVFAEDMERDSVKGQIVLKGNVNVTFKGQILNADKATIFLNEKKVIAEGNVILQSLTVHAEGSRLEFNYESNTGLIYDGFIKSGQVVFEGKLVEKLGENEYVATDAVYTACETCPPAWSFSGKRIHAELGGYATISTPILRVGGIPVIILPGLIVPLKSQRQTGFLTPSLSFSQRGGSAFSEEFFWAISRSQDLTLSLARYDKLGYKSGAEYRYVLSEESRGFLATGHLRDKQIKNEDLGDDVDKDFDRWFLRYGHYYKLPDDYVHRLTVNAASDLRYPRDFAEDMPMNGDPAFENKMSLSKNTKNQHFSVEAIMYTNLLKRNPLADNDDAVNRFPEIKYSLTETRVLDTDLLFSLDATFINFGRGGLSYDDVSWRGNPANPCVGFDGTEATAPDFCATNRRDGSFDVSQIAGQRDIIRTGQRLDIEPSISYPVLLGNSVSITPSVTYRETQYKFDLASPVNNAPVVGEEDENYSNFAARRYLQTDLVAKTRFHNIYAAESMDEISANRLKHEVEPEIGFSRIPWIRRPEHSFFGEFEGQPYSQANTPLTDADVLGRNRLQFDYEDRTFDKNLVNLQITNRFTRKRWVSGTPQYKEVVLFRLGQSYDFNEASSDVTPQPWSTVNALLDVKLDSFETYTQAAYYPYAKLTNVSSRLKFLLDTRNYLQLSYLRSVPVSADNVARNDAKTEVMGVGGGVDSKYLMLSGNVVYSNTLYKIQGWNSAVLFKPPGNCWGISVTINQAVGGELTSKFNASFNYGGEAEMAQAETIDNSAPIF